MRLRLLLRPFQAISDYRRRHPYRWHRLQERLLLLMFSFFIIGLCWFGSLEPDEEQQVFTDVRRFFNNIFDPPPEPETISAPVVKKPPTNTQVVFTYKTSFAIYDVEQINDKTVLYGTIE